MNTFEIIRSFLCDRLALSPRDIRGKSLLTEDLGADSIDRINLAMDIEEYFRILVSDEDAASFTTIDSVVEFIERETEK